MSDRYYNEVFLPLLQRGEFFEFYVLQKYIKKKYKKIDYFKFFVGSNKYFDFEVTFQNGDTLLFEIKNDLKFKRTGNLFIEFSSFGKPSGIEVTKCDFFCIGNTDILFVFPLQELKDIIELTKPRVFKLNDLPGNQGYLLRVTDEIKKKYSYVFS